MRGDAIDQVPEARSDRDEVLFGLVAGMAAGDESALAAFYDATLGKVYGLALRVTGRPETAEEVAEDVYLQAWRQAGDYSPRRGSVLAWLMTICRSRALDALRRRDQALAHPDPWSLPVQVPASEDDPLRVLLGLERGHALHEGLKALGADQRQMLALAFFRDLSHQEIADRLGMPLGTVKSQLRRAMAALELRLNGSNDLP